MARTTGLNHLGLTVRDLNVTTDFFENVLGWEVTARDAAYPRTTVTDGALRLTLWQVQTDTPAPFDRKVALGLHHLALEVADEATLTDLAATLAIAAPALGATEASTAIIIGRKSSENFDTDMIGSKRFRTIADGLARLDANLPRDFADRPDIANFAAVTLIDYVVFRFADRDWLADLPNLAAWRERQKGHPSVEATIPYM